MSLVLLAISLSLIILPISLFLIGEDSRSFFSKLPMQKEELWYNTDNNTFLLVRNVGTVGSGTSVGSGLSGTKWSVNKYFPSREGKAANLMVLDVVFPKATIINGVRKGHYQLVATNMNYHDADKLINDNFHQGKLRYNHLKSVK